MLPNSYLRRFQKTQCCLFDRPLFRVDESGDTLPEILKWAKPTNNLQYVSSNWSQNPVAWDKIHKDRWFPDRRALSGMERSTKAAFDKQSQFESIQCCELGFRPSFEIRGFVLRFERIGLDSEISRNKGKLTRWSTELEVTRRVNWKQKRLWK